jgi:hypothetical protein
MVEVHSEQYATGKADRCIKLSSEPDIGRRTSESPHVTQGGRSRPNSLNHQVPR